MKSISKIALLFSVGVILYAGLIFYPKWEQSKTEATLSWDVSGYYLYLPAMLIYKDAKKMVFMDSILQKYYPTPDFQQAFKHEASGNYVMKYASGQAIAMLPWFAIGHLWASFSNEYLSDGFSFPYQFWVGFGMLIWALLGLMVMVKILRRYYDDLTVAISIVVLVLGTNYLNYAAIDQAMTHSILFTIYALVIWHTIRFYEQPHILRALGIGLLCGWATLIRPTDGLSVFIPLLWGISTAEEARARLLWIKDNLKVIAVFSIGVIVVVAIQPIYWKWATGEWIVYSYQDQGFSWLSPHVKNYTLSYKSGWLRYCPTMFLAFLGLIPFLFERINRWAVVLLFGLAFYLVTAWDIWDYGGSSGRAMVQYYTILIFPIASLVKYSQRHNILKIAFGVVALLGIYLNIWWVYHAHKGEVQILNITKEYYWKKVGTWSSTEADTKLLDNNYSYDDVPMNPLYIHHETFDGDSLSNIVEVEGNKMYLLDAQNQYSKPVVIQNPHNGRSRIRVFGHFKRREIEWNEWRQALFILKFFNGSEEIQSNMIKIHRYILTSEEREIFLDAKIPPAWTRAEIFIWNADSDKPLWVDDIRVMTFDER